MARFHQSSDRQIDPGHQRDMPVKEVRDGWRICCQSSIMHRFDCKATRLGDRVGCGPLLPRAEATAAELVAGLKLGG